MRATERAPDFAASICGLFWALAASAGDVAVGGAAAPTTTASPDPELAGRYRGRLGGPA
jgi:hypothetical protein